MMKIGVFGGSFNPIHIGHLIMAELFRENFKLDKVLFVPASVSPFKQSSDGFLDDRSRLKLIELSIEDNADFVVETYELESGGVSFTCDTLSYLKEKYSNSKFVLLIGKDQALRFAEWKNTEHILSIAHIAIVNRDDELKQSEIEQIDSIFSALNGSYSFIDNPRIDINSTMIRHRLQNGNSIRYLVPEKARVVLENIIP